MTQLHSRTSRSNFLASTNLYYKFYFKCLILHVKLIKTCVATHRWGNIEFPLPFGRVLSPTESFIHGLDEKVASAVLLHLIF